MSKLRVKPDLQLDRVPLTYRPGIPYTTGKVIGFNGFSPSVEFTEEQKEYAKKYWEQYKTKI